jgi:hypothetical protein
MSGPMVNVELQSRSPVSIDKEEWTSDLTVKPFERVVHSVCVGSRGVAKPRLMD